jgi:alpha-mannosidase
LVNLGSEGCLFVDGTPVQGITNPSRTPGFETGKRRIEIADPASGGEPVSLLVEAAANELFGYRGTKEFVFAQAELAAYDSDMWQLGIDLDYLYKLYESLPGDSIRARRILAGLNQAANLWNGGEGAEAVGAVAKELLAYPAVPSATTAWSIGHAHLDLGWLWPVRESRRKAGRTFSTALLLLDEYPDYVFGASQPQQYQWVKEDYPELYRRIKAAVAGGRWEPQGAMWVEPDMNVPSGESLVRQLIFGKRFYKEEFGYDVKNLWLPDVFGYSAALPQILRKAGVDFFATQKISWNETNVFPHHTFLWEGIDGTRIQSHFLPCGNYNVSNLPSELRKGERTFAQAEISNDWLNLYGVGDGGGGPSRMHIEMARRAADTEGSPRVKLARADSFFDEIAKIPAETLPVWRGELYLEKHRGTYTTQGLMKRNNRLLELRIRDAEMLAVLSGKRQRERMERIWKDVLLNQFHDILPGSSITQVYEVANEESAAHLRTVEALTLESLDGLYGASDHPSAFVVANTHSWERRELVSIPVDDGRTPIVLDHQGHALPSQPVEGGVLVPVNVPSVGHTTVSIAESAADASEPAPTTPEAQGVSAGADGSTLENELLTVTLGENGTVTSIFDKEHAREALSGPANRLMTWEDLPHSYDAWDISHYYRETSPRQATLLERELVESGPLRATVYQRFTVSNSTIEQWLTIESGSKLVKIRNRVDWNESHLQLRVEAEAAVHALSAAYEIQFGVVNRPAHGNTSWDDAQFEVPGHRFADISQADYGLGIVNDCKYGHYIRGNSVDLTLLRSPKHPDPTADIGVHEFTYGYYPHASSWQSSDLLERAHDLNAPLIVHGVGSGPNVGHASEFFLDGGTVKLEVIKEAEDGDGIILRFYETRGESSGTILCSRRPLRSVEEVDLLERRVGAAPDVRRASKDNFSSEVDLEFTPFEIRTFRIHTAG